MNPFFKKINFIYLFLGLLFIIICCKKDDESCEPMVDLCDLSSIQFNPTPFDLEIPNHFPNVSNEILESITNEKVSLGRKLFYDPILSRDSTISCSTCHIQSLSFTDGRAKSIGIDGESTPRGSMSLVNLIFFNNGFQWAGEAETLKEQASLPVDNPIELHGDWGEIEQRLALDENYPLDFRKAFGIEKCTDISQDMVVDALASFQSTIISKNTRYDSLKMGLVFFNEQEARGFDKFFDVSPGVIDLECGHCHTDPTFTSNQFLDNGLTSALNFLDFEDLGRGGVTGFEVDNGKFKAPTLRNILLTAPYMHDGRFQTIEQVIDHYNKGGEDSNVKNPLLVPLEMTNQDKEDLIAFLKTLNDRSVLTNPDFSDPF